ncbi:MAG TPA: VOC family protein [Polyangiales bacterium]|nr:VOC family protein [Polyangiales bacterium]
MSFSLGPVGQVALNVANADRSEVFFGETLGLRKLFRFGTLVFFDCAGLRLLLEQSESTAAIESASPIYFRVADIALARRELEARGVTFVDQLHCVAPMPDHDLWMTFFRDPDQHLLALMMEAPKGYSPAR